MTLKVGAGACVEPFMVMDVIAAANQLTATAKADEPRVIHMEVGQPSGGAPEPARHAAACALAAAESLGYTETLGLMALRSRIAEHYQEWYRLSLPSSRVAVVAGASAGFPLAFLAAFDHGDTIALATPCYPPYLNVMEALGLKPLILEADETTGFQPTVERLAALPVKPDGLLIASPANPTGSMLRPDDLAALAVYCEHTGIRLISDEIYHGLTYGQRAVTAASFSRSAIVINSFSKYFSMTGWRIGWMIVPEDLVRTVECLAQNLFICAPHVSQVAALAAFEAHSELTARRDGYARSRGILLDALPRAGYRKLSPADGAFYIYADASHTGMDSTEVCAKMLTEQRIAITPGHDFDRGRGASFVRFSYCAAEADVAEAVRRLTAGLV